MRIGTNTKCIIKRGLYQKQVGVSCVTNNHDKHQVTLPFELPSKCNYLFYYFTPSLYLRIFVFVKNGS